MKTILSCIVLAITLTSAGSDSIEKTPKNYAYTAIAFAHKPGWVYGYTEYECINDCDDFHRCYIDSSDTKYECIHKRTPAPLAKTYRYRQKIWDECLSRCGTIGGTDYQWCYVDQEKNWDYCNGDTGIAWVHDQKYTSKAAPCKNDCSQDCGFFSCSFTCLSYWNTTEYCDPTKRYNYVRAKTVNNKPCLGVCSFAGEKYRWCYHGTKKSDYDYCAEPLMPPFGDWSDAMDSLMGRGDVHERVDETRRRRAASFISSVAELGVAS